jgi:HPt (histidine-containing phosphotransfer) domain-containing protein
MENVMPIETVDWAAVLKQMRGNPKVVQVLVEATLAEMPNMLAAVRSAIDKNEASALRLAAHTLKGTLRYYGDLSAFQWAVCLEKMGANGDQTDAAETYAKLQSALDPLLRSLRAYLDENAAGG